MWQCVVGGGEYSLVKMRSTTDMSKSSAVNSKLRTRTSLASGIASARFVGMFANTFGNAGGAVVELVVVAAAGVVAPAGVGAEMAEHPDVAQ